LLRELEGHARSRGRLEEQVHDRRAAQRRHLLDRALADLLERLRGIENESDLLARERLQTEQVLAERLDAGHPSVDARITASLPSSSCTKTSTRWPRATSTFLPTTSGEIGSSRPPRSITTASAMRFGRPKSANSSRAARTVRPV